MKPDAKIINVVRDLSHDECIEVLRQCGIETYPKKDAVTLKTLTAIDIIECSGYSPLTG